MSKDPGPGRPRAAVRLERLASGRTHIMLVHDDGWSMLCGSLADQDLAQLARDDWRMYVNLFDVARCDHGPTAGGARAAEQLRTTPIEDQLGLARPAS